MTTYPTTPAPGADVVRPLLVQLAEDVDALRRTAQTYPALRRTAEAAQSLAGHAIAAYGMATETSTETPSAGAEWLSGLAQRGAFARLAAEAERVHSLLLSAVETAAFAQAAADSLTTSPRTTGPSRERPARFVRHASRAKRVRYAHGSETGAAEVRRSLDALAGYQAAQLLAALERDALADLANRTTDETLAAAARHLLGLLFSAELAVARVRFALALLLSLALTEVPADSGDDWQPPTPRTVHPNVTTTGPPVALTARRVLATLAPHAQTENRRPTHPPG